VGKASVEASKLIKDFIFKCTVQQGLVIPGEGNKVKVRSGSSLGLGIYTSPSPDFSFQ